MYYRPLGRTGVSVSQMCLGAMMFGAFGNPDHDESIKIIHRALDAGINFVDTADGYSAGESELIVGEALAGGRRESVVLAVKFGVPFGEDPNHRGASRRWITEAVEGSLRRLQTDWIDLYQVGVPDPTPRAGTEQGHDAFGREPGHGERVAVGGGHGRPRAGQHRHRFRPRRGAQHDPAAGGGRDQLTHAGKDARRPAHGPHQPRPSPRSPASSWTCR
jgi:predicted oxidoreductase